MTSGGQGGARHANEIRGRRGYDESSLDWNTGSEQQGRCHGEMRRAQDRGTADIEEMESPETEVNQKDCIEQKEERSYIQEECL